MLRCPGLDSDDIMGSATSSDVKTISLGQKQSAKISDSNHNRIKTLINERQDCQDTSSPVDNVGKAGDLTGDNWSVVAGMKENVSETKDLQKQIAAVESEKLDLLDRIQLLEERIAQLDSQVLVQGQTDCQETVHAKDQYIAQLQHETTVAQDQVKKLRIRLKRRTKALSTQVTEAKQESSIRLLELRDEIARLTEENFKLHENLQISETSCSARGDVHRQNEAPHVHDAGRSNLILELSQQMSEQSDRIQLLESQLAEKDNIIEDLKVKLKKKPVPEDPELLELKSVAEENDTTRGSSCQSRDSGIGVLSEPRGSKTTQGRETTQERPTSASSTISGISLTTPDDARERFGTKVHSAPVGHMRGRPPIACPDLVAMETSAESSTEHSQTLKNTKKKKKLNLRQRLKSEDAEPKPLTPFNAFDSDVDLDADLLLESLGPDCFNTNISNRTRPMAGSVS